VPINAGFFCHRWKAECATLAVFLIQLEHLPPPSKIERATKSTIGKKEKEKTDFDMVKERGGGIGDQKVELEDCYCQQ
jgi:hypothetical protein